MKNALTQYDNDTLCYLYKSQHALVQMSRKCVRSCIKNNDGEGANRYERLYDERSADLLRIGVALLHNNPGWDHNNLTDIIHHHAI